MNPQHLSDAEWAYEVAIRRDSGVVPEKIYFHGDSLQRELDECQRNMSQVFTWVNKSLDSREVYAQWDQCILSRLTHYDQRLGRIGLGYETEEQRDELQSLKVEVTRLSELMVRKSKEIIKEQVAQTRVPIQVSPARTEYSQQYEQVYWQRRYEVLMNNNSGHTANGIERSAQDRKIEKPSGSAYAYNSNQINLEQKSDHWHWLQNKEKRYHPYNTKDYKTKHDKRKPHQSGNYAKELVQLSTMVSNQSKQTFPISLQSEDSEEMASEIPELKSEVEATETGMIQEPSESESEPVVEHKSVHQILADCTAGLGKINFQEVFKQGACTAKSGFVPHNPQTNKYEMSNGLNELMYRMSSSFMGGLISFETTKKLANWTRGS